MSESTRSSRTIGEVINLYDIQTLVLRNDKLCYPLAAIAGTDFFSNINENDLYLTSVICIYRTRTI